MKKKIYFLFLILSFSFISIEVKAQCPPGDIGFYSQAEIDAFAINYPNCTEISGDLDINNSNITNLNGLSNLTSVGGSLYINSTNLPNLDGLSNLTSVGGALDIGYNFNVTNLEGLGNLTSIGDDLYIYLNGLQNLNGLSNLTNVGHNLIIDANSNLTNIDGLSNLTSVGGDLVIVYNYSLPNLDGLSNLTSIEGDLAISYNNYLTDISGLQNIDLAFLPDYEAGLYITHNSLLSVCNLPNLCTYLSNPANPRNIYGNAGNCLDEATVTAECDPCIAPVDLGVENIGSGSAKLIWEAGGDLFEIEWGEAGFAQGSGTTITNIVENQYELSGLQAETAYEFYVRTDCGGYNQSDWTGPFSFTTFPTCPSWDLTFYSQQDLDNFGFPDCTHFPGNVIIKGYNITDLSNLSQLQSIGGNLEIENNSILTQLDAFPLLESIGGQLRINYNPQLESIATFEHLESIGLIFSLFGNESLTEISGFSELNHVGTTLSIGGNPFLSDLEWLSALQTVGSICGIYNNPALVNLSGLDNLESVGDYLDINNNNNLISLQGLGLLQTTGGLNIYNNPALSSLGGLDILTEINGFFSITNNASLTHLNELSPLTQINGPIFIQNHPLLSDISGLQNIEPAGISGLHILDNPNLETCNLESFCSYLSQGGYVEVSGNSGNCSSYSTFVAECTPCDPPINLGVDNLSTTTVSLIWESEGELFDVEWGTAGFVQGNGTLVTEISGNILDLYLLNPNSSYDFYVRQNCLDVNKESEWAGPFSFSTLSPCPTGSLIFNTQQQIDDFGAIYPHCTEALSITIQGNDITNLNGLSNISYIHQSLTINENPLLENLQGLENLHVVGTGLYIADNDQLVDVNGLTNLQSIGVSLDVRDNPMLENLDGFTNLYSIGSMGFSIMNNSQLTNIDGLSNVYIETSNRINISDNASLQSITGFNNLISTTQITIFFNPSLISINGLNGLQQAGSTIITHNQSLQSIEGFAGLQTTGSLVITNNPDLETMSAFGSLQSIESGYFGITHSKLENLDNFSSLYFSGGEVDFSHNTALENLNGLIGLQSIGGNLNIFINPALENLDGLVNVQSIGGYLLVSQNDVLSDISGLQNIDPATIGGAYGLRIYYNPNLYICNLENLCTYLQGSGIRYIAANAGTCFNEASLGNSCIPCETPQTLGAADVYATQATLLWEGAEALFEIEWGEAGFTHGNGTVISEISENEYILNGLNSATSYEFYVRRDCTLSHYSDWEGPYGFITMPCPTGNFTFTTQQEIDNFETIYGGCTDIVLNSLHIGPDFGNPGDITDLTPLQNIKSVNGNVTIQYNPLLTNLSGLENLTEIGGNLTIYNNLVLTSIDELSSLTEITGDLYIGYNESLTGIYGFNTLENVGNLTISFNNYLDIQGFQNLNQVNGNLILTSLTMANFLSFESLEQIDGELILQYSYINDLSGFNALISMGGLSFSYTTLAEVSGLNSLQSINGRIKIVGTNITNLDFLHNITTINGELNIGANHNLDDISGLQNIHHSSIQYLSFIENSNLYVCNLPNLCTYLSNPANPRNIYGNAGNCLDEATVTADCTPCAAPVDLGVENIQTNAAKLIWEADGDLFEIEWGEAGFTQGAGTTITDIVENQYELSGLQGGTSYEFYVRTDCGGFNQSDWTGPFGFTTLLCPTGDFIFTSQPEIDDFGALYGHCTIVTGSIIINGADITNLAGLSALESIGGILYIYNNPQLESLSGLSNLTTVGNDVSVFYNTQLENLDGLNSLTAIGGALDINSNNNLADISALQNIDPVTITHLYIRENLNLSVCNLPNFCTYLSNPSNPRTISGNAGDCISEMAIMDACDLSGNCDTYTIWDGLTWSNGTPDANKRMIIEGNLTLTEDLTACEILLNSGIITINPDVTLTVNGQIINTQTAEAFTVKSDGVLIQVDEVENTGAITVWRNSSPMKRLDYTLWSSPVSGMLLKNFSEVSPSGGYGTLWNRVYTLGETAWEQVWADQEIYLTDNSMTFTEGTGYLYRSRNDYDAVNTVVFEGEFTGVPQNGTITIDAPYLFNAVGNPYPSPIDADEILAGGASALYFWTNSNAPNQSGTYVSNNWATYSGAGGAIASNGNQTPDGIIQTAQGFVVGFETANPSRQVTFNNTMRLAEHYGQFFKQMSNEKHRLWLNLSDEAVTYNQILVGYIENATQGFDTGIDAKMFAYEGNAIYSLIENSEEKFVIQGRELPFTDADVVPIGFRAVNAGSFTISLNNFDGLFEEGNTQIYLKDNFNQTQHNLNDGAYTFVSEEGIFDNRFEIVYQTTMSVENPDVSNADWIVYRKKDGFQIQTNGFDMKEVSVYDLLGRKIYASQAEGVTHHIPNIGTEGVYIVKVITTEHQILSKKVR